MSAELIAAHRHSSLHRSEVERSSDCGCFFCRSVFPPAAIASWVDEAAQPSARPGQTAVCPHTASGLPVTDTGFLGPMHEWWFR